MKEILEIVDGYESLSDTDLSVQCRVPNSMTQIPKHAWGVVYRGAPYHPGETGHVVQLYTTKNAAVAAADYLAGTPSGYDQCYVAEVEDGRIVNRNEEEI